MADLHVELLLDEQPLEGAAFEQQVKRAVEENESEFHALMGRLAQALNMRAQFEEETLEVTDVSADGKGGVISVTFAYGAYYGCKDMDGGDDIQDDWEFARDGNKLVFDLPLPPERDPDEI